MSDGNPLVDAVLLLMEIQVFVPPHQRDEIDRLSLRMYASLSAETQAKLPALAKARAEAREAALERQDNEVVFTRAKPLPSDPDLVWKLGVLRGRLIAIEAWLRGEDFPEEMLLEVQEQDEALRARLGL
jgi:hypothetical protein